MKLSLTHDHRLGWLLADEPTLENDQQSFSYVIAWRPDVKFEDIDVVLARTSRGSFSTFALEFNCNLFIEPQTEIRFALNDPLSPQDFRGLPFLRSFPYLGTRSDVLAWYGVTEFFAFLPLIPLDLIKMDRLDLDQALVFVGVTSKFGAHVSSPERVIQTGPESKRSGRPKATASAVRTLKKKPSQVKSRRGSGNRLRIQPSA